MRRWGVVCVVALVLGGCVTPSTIVVNDQGHLYRCAAHGHGYIGAPMAESIHASCVRDMQRAGYVPVPMVGLGVRNNLQSEITAVQPGSDAAAAGLQVGDKIVAMDDVPILVLTDGMRQLGTKQPGDTVRVTVQRGEDRLTLPLILPRRGE